MCTSPPGMKKRASVKRKMFSWQKERWLTGAKCDAHASKAFQPRVDMSLGLHEHLPCKNNGNYCLENFTSVCSRWDKSSTPSVISPPGLKFYEG